MKHLLMVIYFFVSFQLLSQITYYNTIEPIIAVHCLPCHTSKNIGPMPLNNYYSVKAYANMIYNVAVTNVMPPYQIDLSYSNEKILHNSLQSKEIDDIKKWIEQSFLQGEKKAIESVKESINENEIITFPMESTFEVKTSKEENTQIFVIPVNSETDIFTNKIQFIPGRKEFIKSAFIFIDTSEESIKFDNMDRRYGYTNYSSVAFKPKEYAWYGWNPYDSILNVSSEYVKKIPKKSNLLLQVTYKPYHKNYRDSTSLLKIWKVPQDTLKKIIYSDFIIDSTYLLNKPFLINKNELKTIIAERITEKDLEVHSIRPFGQNVLKSYFIYSVDESGKNTPFLKIPQWDIHWKKKYIFEEPIMIKEGSKIVVEATYDFTEENTKLPIIPLGRITYGEGSKNELLLIAMDVSYPDKIN